MSAGEEKTCCTSSNLDIFVQVPHDISIKDSNFIAIETKNNLAENTPIEFVINKYDQSYVDFSESYLDLSCKVQKIKNGRRLDLGEHEKVIPNANLLNTIFQRVDLDVQGKVLTASTNTYSYKSFIEYLFGYDKQTQDHKLTEQLFCLDGPGNHAVTDPTDLTDETMKTRAAAIAKSREFFVRGKLSVDFFNSNKSIPNGVSVHIRLTRNKPEFIFNADLTDATAPDGFKLTILSAKLWVAKIEPSVTAFKHHIESFEKTDAKYNFLHSNIWSKLLHKDATRFSESNIFSGNVPNFLILTFVKNKAFLGDYAYNPYEFVHAFINYLCVTIDGKPRPIQNYKFDFEKKNFLDGFHTLFDKSPHVPPITTDSYTKGYFFVVIDLTDNSSGFSLINSGPKHGNVDLEITFSKPLDENYILLIYHATPATVHINKTREVIKDYLV